MTTILILFEPSCNLCVPVPDTEELESAAFADTSTDEIISFNTKSYSVTFLLKVGVREYPFMESSESTATELPDPVGRGLIVLGIFSNMGILNTISLSPIFPYATAIFLASELAACTFVIY